MDLEKIKLKVMSGEEIIKYRLVRSIWLAGAIKSCDLSESMIKDCIFFRTNIKSTRFMGSTFTQVRFVCCDISKCDFMGATFLSCTFEDCVMTDNNMSMCVLDDIELMGSKTSNTALNDSRIKRLDGWFLREERDSKKNLIIYNASERIVSHSLVAGAPEDCVKRLWENETLPKKYVESLAAQIVRMSNIKVGKSTLK